jgi:hypothetical protein
VYIDTGSSIPISPSKFSYKGLGAIRAKISPTSDVDSSIEAPSTYYFRWSSVEQ